MSDTGAREALAGALAILERIEWRPEMTVAGTRNDFCPICGGTPSMVRLNPRTTRPDGHRTGTQKCPDGCPLARALDVLRAAIAEDHDTATTTGAAVRGEEGTP